MLSYRFVADPYSIFLRCLAVSSDASLHSRALRSPEEGVGEGGETRGAGTAAGVLLEIFFGARNFGFVKSGLFSLKPVA